MIKPIPEEVFADLPLQLVLQLKTDVEEFGRAAIRKVGRDYERVMPGDYEDFKNMTGVFVWKN